jgi:uncharacterized membrane protein YhhN
VRWAFLAAAGASALGNWWSRARHDDRLELFTKPLTTALVIGVALTSGAAGSRIAVAVAALALCLVGDVALLPAIDRFVVGLGAFLLGHLAFIVLFAQYGLDRWDLALVAFGLVAAMVLVVGRVIVRSAAAHDRTLRIPVIAYLTIISAMAVTGWATGRSWVIAGSALFVVSDAVLGWRQFVHPRRWMPVTVMVTYHAALAALVISLW